MRNRIQKYAFHLIFSALILSICACPDVLSQTVMKMHQTKTQPVAPGSFGGMGIIVTVGKNSVKIEYDCADGEILHQLKTDKKGNFKIDGTHLGPNVGPIRRDDQRKPALVRYEGQIVNKLMKLKVTNIKTGEVLGEYTLERGKPPVMHRCA
jgi:hypothetical protein